MLKIEKEVELTANDVNRITSDMAERLYYIAKLNPRGVNKIATKYGYPAPQETLEGKFNFLSLFFQEEGNNDNAIDELVIAHPDFGLFAETLSNKVKNKLKSRIPIESEEEFVDIEDFEGFDGFIENSEVYYSNDNLFIDAIAGAVKGVAGTAGKAIGTGKRGTEAKQQAASEQTKQLQLQNKQAKVADKENTKRMIIYSSIGFVIFVVLVLVYVFVIRKKK